MSKEPLQVGPYENVRTTTIKFAPIDITITTADKSTHVPPAPCSCGGGNPLEQMLAAIMQRMRGPESPSAPDAEPNDGPTSPA